MVIKALSLSALEAALNSYLALSENRTHFLAPLAGKVIAVTITPFDETFYLCPTSDSIQLLNEYPYAVDTRLTGSLLALGLMGTSTKPARSLFSGKVTIEGDTHTGHKLQELFDKLDVNLESRIARLTGESFARKLTDFFSAGQNWTEESLESFKLNTIEYLQEETCDLPAIAEANSFYDKIDKLRTDFDRLQSRIERLENTLNKQCTIQN